MYDDYYGPGSEEYDRDMYEEFQRDYQESKQEYEQYKWEKEQEQQMYEDERALQDTLDDAAREDCHADYSSGKKPTMDCDYHTGSSSTNTQDSAIIGGIVFAVIIAAIIGYFIFKSKKNKRW